MFILFEMPFLISFFTLPGHHARVFDLAFSPTDPNLVASASDDDTAKIWQQSEGAGDFKQVSSFHGHNDSVLRVSWAPDGRLLASGMDPGTRPLSILIMHVTIFEETCLEDSASIRLQIICQESTSVIPRNL
jgi:hypothetical protein